MLLLFTTIICPVEPVPGKKGWYQLTGKGMYRTHGYDASAYHSDAGDAVIKNARILGIHDDEEILAHDVRVNGSRDDEPSIVVFDDGPGGLKAAIDVNSVEGVIFRFLVPHEECAWADDEDVRPHRIEPKRPRARKQPPAAH